MMHGNSTTVLYLLLYFDHQYDAEQPTNPLDPAQVAQPGLDLGPPGGPQATGSPQPPAGSDAHMPGQDCQRRSGRQLQGLEDNLDTELHNDDTHSGENISPV